MGTVNPHVFDLQGTLSMSSAMSSNPAVAPHHPVACREGLRYYEDGSLECDHVRVEADDRRIQACIDHSIAILLIECLREREAHAG